LENEGCQIFGFADLRILPPEPRKGLDVSIVKGAPYTAEGMKGNLEGNSEKYATSSRATFELLDRYQKTVLKFLKEKKYKASITYRNTGYLNGITHKMVGTLAGIGWIGRCAILTTKKFGPTLRLTAVLTNAPLECGKPITKSMCSPKCNECVNICPAKAIKEGLWEQGIHRDTFFDVAACRKILNSRRKNGTEGLCGLCISACPYTKNGLGYE
jgi:epoxyqueuosine reductase QueG